ncbi:NAD(P)/FAD-dependent oxidoreductase [Paenibacillus tyrfis]|uniref:NAD(P)/FAD-dependent oxidoreductase n=1 Tax=Paenibacillus tyrfis TaxID=1501230 RepID=UPI00209F28C9|nr:NAD(P)/FAD-dependent oxidoreductase [Paenibacillus tyrfis]MCP1311251.1 NAD(P)/FAD-dependent oxidoreductase [Paenibacillus tyrfis]
MKYDVIVIGGGPSGLMACIAASRQGARVVLVDKGDKLGRKLGISGGGRCNVTNAKEIDEIIKHIPGNGRFLHSAFAHFGNREIIAFFENLGIRLKEEDNGRMFPVTDKAKTVVDALVGQVRKQGVDIKVNRAVERVLYQDGRTAGIRLRTGETIAGKCVIIASGGKSVPYTGSTGDGYAWAEDAGHTITPLFPTEVPLTSGEPFIKSRELQGLSLRNVELTVWNAKGKKIISHQGDMLFTHFGLSGPITLRCSQFVVKERQKTAEQQVLTTIDLHPDKSAQEIYDETMALAKSEPKKAAKNVLKGYVSERLVPLLLRQAGLDEQTTYDNIPKQPWMELSKRIKAFPVQVNGTLSIEEAFVTGGGVNLKELDPRTMGSKLMEGLFFCGEILDIHGYTGGYNITAAFATGFTAGTFAAQAAQGSFEA